ncbi:hypothetical protein [Clostridium sp. JN-9]|uniref:hypothetical protein n=1 Tax=Clostridium sp. JN-9 TaxID=2507159 RepID=UPI000FFDFE53|nr:hypothetical protein [Clostridium sp. JN-9]QAT40656.1 hypothetical protein EQM05_10485 [Clostridium sp. JN-9]
MHILEHIDDLESIEKIIRKNAEDSSDWTSQHLFFELLKNFYERYNSGFDEVKRTIMHHLYL